VFAASGNKKYLDVISIHNFSILNVKLFKKDFYEKIIDS